jgi:hypothetical protein
MLSVVLAIAMFGATSTASASSLTASEKMQVKKTYYHSTGYISAIWKNARRTVYHPNHAKREKWLKALAFLKQQRATAWKKLHPAPVINHWAGWSCITNGAHPGTPGDPHEGNGYNPAGYVGPLGMTTPWMGYSPTGSDWVHTPVAVVYSIAEKVSAKYGWSDVWMRGQWPRTYPPCARFFGH